jgi:uncharacterized membrane protein YeaQ/YmgE (transglycosylase-associated protein family)
MGIAVELPTGRVPSGPTGQWPRAEDLVTMLHIVIWLVVGALIGFVAGLLMRGNDDQTVFVNVLVGVLGALIAGWLVAPFFGLHAGDPKVLDFSAVSIALVGAIVALALLSLLRGRGRKR